MLDVCCDLMPYDVYVAMVRARNECQPTTYMSSHNTFCFSSLLRESVVQAKFLLVPLLNTLLAEPESHNALVVIWSGERRTPRITRRDSAQAEHTCETCGHSTPLFGRLYRAKKRVLRTIHAWIVSSCVVVVRVACTTRHEHLSPHFAHFSFFLFVDFSFYFFL